jgi:hypothetical protein
VVQQFSCRTRVERRKRQSRRMQADRHKRLICSTGHQYRDALGLQSSYRKRECFERSPVERSGAVASPSG